METQKLIVRLPQDDLKLIKQFGVHRISPKLQQITGILPQSLGRQNVKQDYYDYLLDKHTR